MATIIFCFPFIPSLFTVNKMFWLWKHIPVHELEYWQQVEKKKKLFLFLTKILNLSMCCQFKEFQSTNCSVFIQDRRGAKESPNAFLLGSIAKYITKMFKVTLSGQDLFLGLNWHMVVQIGNKDILFPFLFLHGKKIENRQNSWIF